jgi:hypothetical protein
LKIFFTNKDHKYFSISEDNGNRLDWESVSRFESSFDEPYNYLFHSLRRAFKEVTPKVYKKVSSDFKWYDTDMVPALISLVSNNQYQDILIKQKEVIASWEELGYIATEAGTEYHDDMEAYYLKQGYCINDFDGQRYIVVGRPKSDYDNEYCLPDVLKEYWGYNVCILECLIADYSSLTCGQADRAFFKFLGNKYVHYGSDYKTDSKPITNYCFWSKKGPVRYKYPLSFFKGSRLNKYKIKMSSYACLLLRELGIPTLGSDLIHVDLKNKSGISEKRIILDLYLDPIMEALDLKVDLASKQKSLLNI